MTMLAPDLDEAATGEAVSAEMPSTSTELFAMLDSLPATKRWRAESLDGETITLSPTPIGLHQENVYQLSEQLRPHVPPGSRIETYLEIRMPDLGRSVIPDLFVAPREALLTQNNHISPDDVLLVAEIVSRQKAHRDREDKREIYARAGIETYMIVDPLLARTSVCTNVKDDDYGDIVTLHFGAEMPVPDPFDFTLDTGEFHAY